MKLVSYETSKQVRVGVVEGEWVVDVRAAVEMVSRRRVSRTLAARPAFKAAARALLATGFAPRSMTELLARGPEWQKALAAITGSLAKAMDPDRAPKGLFTPLASAHLRAPIARPAKIVCVGLNYADHAHEQGIEPPAKPIFFLKSVNTISGPGDPILLPPNSDQVDYEAEFAVVIGKGGRDIPEEKAYAHVAGYTILDDVTARDMQHGDKQWFRGKSCDTFAPTGPWITTPDEVPDPHRLSISLTVNGRTMQDSNTSNLIFKVPFLISYLSRSLTWETGDLLSTGTPPGVGVFRKPPVFLKAGDSISVTVERLGTLSNAVTAR
jgi:2-keto-4-pentenoate hydratase/2-oxohepta-3-ene-1,7-dioic acid hydratase in catechol pathway